MARRTSLRRAGLLIALLGLYVASGSVTLHAQTPPKQAVFDTSAGTFVIDLTPATAPNQTAYFLKLAAEGG
jgi:hypothetical protein